MANIPENQSLADVVMEGIPAGVTAPRGFLAATVAVGVKPAAQLIPGQEGYGGSSPGAAAGAGRSTVGRSSGGEVTADTGMALGGERVAASQVRARASSAGGQSSEPGPGSVAPGNAGLALEAQPDVALLYSTAPAAAAGVFTRNRVQAAPVVVSRRHLGESGGCARAIVVNSGNANACTGEAGLAAAEAVARAAAETLGLRPEEVLLASTGVIGVPFPAELIAAGVRRSVPSLSPSLDAGAVAARAIMTTDTRPKEAAGRFRLDETPVTIGGMAKGSGMIHPNMGTMLAFLTTDAAVTPPVLREALLQAVDETFNMVSVDGDTSTNDTVFLLANGLAANPIIDSTSHKEFKSLVQGLTAVCRTLARMIAADGEGATKLLTVEVRGAPNLSSARAIARAVCRSNLVKAALFGRDANWGRVMMAAGCAAVEFDPELVDVFLAATVNGETLSEQVARRGAGLSFDEGRAAAILGQEEVTIILDLNQGAGSATAWGCDLSYDYVRINGAYRT